MRRAFPEKYTGGGGLSSIEILSVLYGAVLNVTDRNLSDTERDKFLLSKGHAALAVYIALYEAGLLSGERLSSFQRDGSPVSEIMEACPELGFETSGGSLGINLSYGVGLALLAKKEGYPYKTYVLVGDGELDEGNVWEAVMLAPRLGLDNLTLIVDANTVQCDGPTRDIIGWENLEERLRAFGWAAVPVDGHDCGELLGALTGRSPPGKPFAVIANTVKGKGVSFMENNYLWHDRLLRGKELELALKEVGGVDGL